MVALHSSELARYAAIEDAFDRLKRQSYAQLGQRDIKYITGLRKTSRAFEAVGRGLLWFGRGPFSFGAGALCVLLHRIIECVEIGHNVLHGQYDYFPEIPEFHSHNFRWKAPIDEEGWRREHNDLHHVHTNVYAKDPDLTHGILRVNDRLPWTKYHLFQVPLYLLWFYPFMMYKFNAQNFGLNQAFRARHFPLGNEGYAPLNYSIEDGDPQRIQKRHRRSQWRIIAKEYIAFPLLAGLTGHSAVRVFLANLGVDMLTSCWMTLTLQVSHFTQPLQEENCLENKGKWYVSQIESTVNFKSPGRWMSVLWGHVDYQIEHHLYPDLPSHRYPDIAPEVQAICRRFDITYSRNPGWCVSIYRYLRVWTIYSFTPQMRKRILAWLPGRRKRLKGARDV